jgi:UbiD family decarboxylase
MFDDLRGFLAQLEDLGQLKRIMDEVSVKHEIAAGMRKTSDIEGPALLFENVKDYPGWRVLGGLFATRKLVALGLGVPREEMLERYLTLEDERIPPEMVATGPCKEIKWTGAQIDLTKLPIVTHASKDCGPYILPSACRSAKTDTGIRNMSIHRMLVLGRTKLSLWAPADHHLGE